MPHRDLLPPHIPLNECWWAHSPETGCDVFANPSRRETIQLWRQSRDHELRGLVLDDGTLLVWDAYHATHEDIIDEFDLRSRAKVGVLLLPATYTVVYCRLTKGPVTQEQEDILRNNPNLRMTMRGDYTVEIP